MCGHLFCNPLLPMGCGMNHGSESEQPHTQSAHFESALEIFRKRYARGEISRVEFTEMKRALA